MFDTNRRRYPRVDYPCQLIITKDNDGDEIISAMTTNMGLGGICVRYQKPIVQATKVFMQLSFANVTTPFKCRGEVMYCQQAGENDYRIGIQFEQLSEPKYAFLEGLIAEILDKQKEEQS